MAPTRGTKPRHHILSVMVENRSGAGGIRTTNGCSHSGGTDPPRKCTA